MVQVYFSRSSGPLALLTRFWTRQPKQIWRYVPAHCGLVVRGRYFEAVSTGVRASNSLPSGGDWIVVPGLDEAAIQGFLQRQLGKPYDWAAIAFDILGVGLPRWAKLQDGRLDKWDCSRIVLAALLAGGYAFSELRLPESPNDIYLNLTERQANGL